MKTSAMTILGLLLVVLSVAMPASAATASKAEALTVAQNWVAVIIGLEGDWGGAATAEVMEIKPFMRGERVLGFFCPVRPKGYIIVSLLKGLVPVKMYSVTCDLDPESEEGMTALIKDSMERVLDAIEDTFGTIEHVATLGFREDSDVDCEAAWDELARGAGPVKGALEAGTLTLNYQQSQELLTSAWNQTDPYNRDCPAPAPGDDCTGPRCAVGCGPLGDAQIMRFWAWPPYGVGTPYSDTYDWVNMPDSLLASSPAAQINAVAELCHEVGTAGNVAYCNGTGCASGNNLLEAMAALRDVMRYSSAASRQERRLYANTAAWFDAIRTQLNLNRPVLYEIPGHVVVVDGWRVIGATPVYQVHVVFGWGGANDGWYSLDYEIPGTDPNWQWEKMIVNIVPDRALGDALLGAYGRDAWFPYRYFDRDAAGSSATFAAGQELQFLPGIAVRCTSTTGGYVGFAGTTSYSTRLFSVRGTGSGGTVAGARIYSGGIRVYGSGCLRFH